MKRAIIVTAGTVAGLAAALHYTPNQDVSADLASSDSGSMGSMSATDGTNGLNGEAAPSVGTDTSRQADPNTTATANPNAVEAPADPAVPATAPTDSTPAPATTSAPAAAAPATTPAVTPAAKPAATTAAKPATKTTPKPVATTKPKPVVTPKPTPKPVVTPKPTPKPTPTVAASVDYQGSVTSASDGAQHFGDVQVTIRVQSGKIIDLGYSFNETHPGSALISNRAMRQLKVEALAAQKADIANVSGASWTTKAFKESLQSALTKAGL